MVDGRERNYGKISNGETSKRPKQSSLTGALRELLPREGEEKKKRGRGNSILAKDKKKKVGLSNQTQQLHSKHSETLFSLFKKSPLCSIACFCLITIIKKYLEGVNVSLSRQTNVQGGGRRRRKKKKKRKEQSEIYIIKIKNSEYMENFFFFFYLS